MRDLKELKETWARQSFDKQFSKEELNAFLQKKSSYSIKWIFYLSVIEFLFYLLLPIILPNYLESYEYYKSLNLLEFRFLSIGVGYALLIYYMWRFYQNYRKISISDSVNDHLTAILKTRKSVNHYFYLSIGILLIFTSVVMIAAFKYDNNLIALQEKNVPLLMILFIVGIVIAIILAIFGLLYYFVYGRFLRSLKRNERYLNEVTDDA